MTTTQTDYARVAAAIEYLSAHYQAQPSLDEIAAQVHLSPAHFQRLFRRWAGISPKRFVQYLTVDYAKSQLAASRSVLETAYAAGLSGPGRLHDLFVAVEAMTPGEYKRQAGGLEIHYGFHASPFGECLLATTARGICHLAFVDGGGQRVARQALEEKWGQAHLVHDQAGTGPVVQQLFDTLGMSGSAQPSPRLLLKGTNFQLKVWTALLQIPQGGLATYGDVAQWMEQPGAARAVGSAVGANSIAVLIPCHRVIRQSGIVGDYRWGTTRKRALIGWEAAHRVAV